MKLFKRINVDKGVMFLWAIIILVIVSLVVTLLISSTPTKLNSPTGFTVTIMENQQTVLYILSVIALLVTTIGNPIHLKRYKRTINFIQSLEWLLLETKTDLSSRISETEHTLKFYIVQRDISNALHKIISDALIYMPSAQTKVITDIGESIVDFALQIHDYGIHQYNPKTLCVKIDNLHKSTIDCISNTFTPEFTTTIDSTLRARIHRYRDEIKEIASDTVTNSKMNRFRVSSESFTQEYLSIIIVKYLERKEN